MKLCSHQPLSHSYPNTAVRINPKKNTCCYFIVPPVTSILQKMARIQYLVKHFSNTVQHYCEKIYFNKVINKSQQNHCCQNYQLLGLLTFPLKLYTSQIYVPRIQWLMFLLIFFQTARCFVICHLKVFQLFGMIIILSQTFV